MFLIIDANFFDCIIGVKIMIFKFITGMIIIKS